MTDLPELLRDVAHRLHVAPNDPLLAAGGRCACVPCRAELFAARGWPDIVAGARTGGRSSGRSSATEAAASMPSPFAGIDDRLADALAKLETGALAYMAVADTVALVDPDDIKTIDVLPADDGQCGCGCGHHCRPRRNPEDRLRSGLAPACYRRWLRWREAYPGVTISDYLDTCFKERGESRAKPVAPPTEPRAS